MEKTDTHIGTMTSYYRSACFKQSLRPVASTLRSNHDGLCGILCGFGKLTLLFALPLKAPESQHGLCRGFRLQKRTNHCDLKA